MWVVLSYISLFILISLFLSILLSSLDLSLLYFVWRTPHCVENNRHVRVLNFLNWIEKKILFPIWTQIFQCWTCALHSSMQTLWVVTAIEVGKASMTQLVKFYSFKYSDLWKIFIEKDDIKHCEKVASVYKLWVLWKNCCVFLFLPQI
jgi:hypothetical protein